MRSSKLFLALGLVIGGSWLQPADAQQASLVSAVLPASRAVQVGAPATAFATMINSGSVTATGCQIALPAGLAADFYYQATDPTTNAPIPGYKNVPVDIGPGQPRSFLIALTPQPQFAAQDVRLRFNCANAPDAAVYSGLNALLLSSSTTPGPDVVALAATVNGNGIVDVPGPTGTGFFAVATVNVGAGATISASANTGSSALPVALSICQTNPATGSCLAPPSAAVTTTINAGATPTFAVFATGSDFIAFHPAGNRISVVFRDAGGAVKGATSVAVRTLGAPPANVAPVANAGVAQTVTTGSTVTLDGSGSSDANGNPLTYAWTLTSKPAGSAASLSGATTVRPSFVADLAGTYVASLVVNDGKVGSTPSTVSVTAAKPAGAEKTVVFRVLTTSPAWGQEPGGAAWAYAAPVKDDTNYRLYDLEIARDASYRPSLLNLLKIQNLRPDGTIDGDTFAAIRASSTIYSKSLSGDSSDLLQSLKAAVDQVLQRESFTRLVIEFSGHGGPTAFFEGTLAMSDASSFVQHVRDAIGNSVLVLDFSTNCSVGYFDFAMYFHDKADYLLASDLNVGGFDPGDFTAWLKVRHDGNLHNFFSTEKSTLSSLASVVSARQAVWKGAEASIVSLKLQQSLSVFKLTEFLPLMRALAAVPTFDPYADIQHNSSNLATYIYSTNDAELIGRLERFRFLYASNRNLFAWESNQLGFGVVNKQALKEYLMRLRSAGLSPAR